VKKAFKRAQRTSVFLREKKETKKMEEEREFALLIQEEIDSIQSVVWAQYIELQKEVDDLRARNGGKSNGSGPVIRSSTNDAVTKLGQHQELVEAAEKSLKQFGELWFTKQKREGKFAWLDSVFKRDRSKGRVKTDFELKQYISQKIEHDMRLAKDIMIEIKDLPSDGQEMRLMEYARVMELNAVEKKIYLDNRLSIFDDHKTVKYSTKILGWAFVIVYCMVIALYVCLFGVLKGTPLSHLFSVLLSLTHTRTHTHIYILSSFFSLLFLSLSNTY
jgi:hypothetical protein